MVTDGATRCSAESTMTGNMTSNAAYQGSLDAPFGNGRGRDRENGNCCQCARKCLVHVYFSQLLAKRWSSNNSAVEKFPFFAFKRVDVIRTS
jgi:hypothetical protein